MNELFDQVRPWIDHWQAAFVGFVIVTLAAGAFLKALFGWLRTFHRGYKAGARYIEVESDLHEMGPVLVQIAAQAPVLAAIAAQFERNGGSSLRDTIESNHADAEKHWTDLSESSTKAIADLAAHLLKLDLERAERAKAMELMQGDVSETKAQLATLEAKLDRWIALITKQEVPEEEVA